MILFIHYLCCSFAWVILFLLHVYHKLWSPFIFSQDLPVFQFTLFWDITTNTGYQIDCRTCCKIFTVNGYFLLHWNHRCWGYVVQKDKSKGNCMNCNISKVGSATLSARKPFSCHMIYMQHSCCMHLLSSCKKIRLCCNKIWLIYIEKKLGAETNKEVKPVLVFAVFLEKRNCSLL